MRISRTLSRGAKRPNTLSPASEGPRVPRCSWTVVFASVLVIGSGSPAVAAEKTNIAAKPNFIVINIDDLGYGDIGPFGSTRNRTPNLDRMAEEGRKLTSFYAAPVCSPSRASLMTGAYPKRALPIPHVLFPGNAVEVSMMEPPLLV